MAILNRHILMHRETVSNQSLQSAFAKASNTAKLAAPAGTPKSGKGSSSTPCQYYTAEGGCRKGDGCPYQHGTPSPAAPAGADSGKAGKHTGNGEKGKTGKGRGKGRGK